MAKKGSTRVYENDIEDLEAFLQLQLLVVGVPLLHPHFISYFRVGWTPFLRGDPLGLITFKCFSYNKSPVCLFFKEKKRQIHLVYHFFVCFSCRVFAIFVCHFLCLLIMFECLKGKMSSSPIYFNNIFALWVDNKMDQPFSSRRKIRFDTQQQVHEEFCTLCRQKNGFFEIYIFLGEEPKLPLYEFIFCH